MEIIKKINNNVALARDAKGRELIVFGKGIGFPCVPYTITDLQGIQRSFYDVDHRYFSLLREIPEKVFLAADDIAQEAQDELDCPLNPNLAFALADHLNFAIQRSREGIALQTPLAYDIQHLYPQEYALARSGLHALNAQLEQPLPETETVSVALHIINAEAEVGDFHSTVMTAKIISELSDIVEQFFDIKLDKSSFNYSRFAMHLRYLVQRMMQGKPFGNDGGTNDLFCTLCRQYPEIYTCVGRMNTYLKDVWGWKCSREEQLYLIIHINRVTAKQQAEDSGGDADE